MLKGFKVWIYVAALTAAALMATGCDYSGLGGFGIGNSLFNTHPSSVPRIVGAILNNVLWS